MTAVATMLAGAFPVFAATYVVPEDRFLVDHSEAIVVATVIESAVRASETYGIETVTSARIEEAIKGPLDGTIDIVEPGGRVGDTMRVISGVPKFENGERLLLMLLPAHDGGWVVLDLALGRFTFSRDIYAETVLVRDESEIVGWDPQLTPYQEKRRSAESFLNFIREEVKGRQPSADYFIPAFPLEPRRLSASVESHAPTTSIAPYTAVSYTIAPGARWPGFASNVSYGRGNTTEPGAPGGGDNAINAAMNAWNGVSGTVIKLLYIGSSPSDTGIVGQNHGDGQNSVQFERNLSAAGPGPYSCSSGGVLGIGGFFSSGTHIGPNGETFSTITEGDVEMNQGIANCTALFNSGDFDTAVTHEVGHSIGFRHSDQDPSDSSACPPSVECSQNAIMRSFITQGIHAQPQTWDQHAAQAVYPGAGGCTPPSINTQPVGSTINSGQSANLSVTAGGTSPFTYQWYTGASGNTSSPIGGATNSSVMVSPTTTTSYWVRVTGQCAPTADSNAATVTVNSTCTPPSISVQPSGSTITSGQSANLSVTAGGTSPFTYQWYTGTSGNTSSPIGGATNSSVMVSPTTTTNYWVRVTGQCAPPVDSSTATVTVGACVNPSISQQPANVMINSGASTQLSVGASGTGLTYQWYVGNPPSTANPIAFATASTVNVAPSQTTNYWVRVSGQCGSPVDSTAATVTVVCNPPAITQQPASTSITSGSSTFLTVSATGSSLTYQWYQGTAPDASNPIPGANNTFVSVSPQTTTSYWVRVSGACGSPQNSSTATVTVGACASPVITGAAANPSNILPGGSAQLSASVSGSVSGQPQWYIGTPPDKTHPVAQAGATVTVSPSSNTTYWLQALSGCGAAPANSNTVTVTVGSSCINPTITIQPASQTVIAGTTATLGVTAGGTAPIHYQWYRGPSGTKTTMVGTDSAFFTTAAVNSTMQFWVEVSNACNGGVPAQSTTATITPYISRHRSTRH
jgi:Ig-like domain CHU_C associated